MLLFATLLLMSAEKSFTRTTVALFRDDFQQRLRSWSLPELKMGAKDVKVKDNGKEVAQSRYTLNYATAQLEWHSPKVPAVLQVEMSLPVKIKGPSRVWEFGKVTVSAGVGAAATEVVRWLISAL